jgi:capsid assembly protease
MSDRLRHVIGFLSQPWAITPEGFETVCAVLDRRAAGVKLSDEDIREIITESRVEFEGRHIMPSGASQVMPVGGQQGGGKIAVISIYGTILPRPVMSVSGGGGAALTQFMAVFQQADSDPNVNAILLDIDSPGGSVFLLAEAAALIAGASTPTTAIANTMAGSAAYYLASQADEVVVTPSGMVGSIGTLARHIDESGELAQKGLKVTLISAGPFKTEGNPYEPLSDEARANMQSIVDEYHMQFVDAVASGRNVSAEEVLANFGGGRMLTAQQALAAGMVDRVETFDATVARMLTAPQSFRTGNLNAKHNTTITPALHSMAPGLVTGVPEKTSSDDPADTAGGAVKPAHGARIARIQRGL